MPAAAAGAELLVDEDTPADEAPPRVAPRAERAPLPQMTRALLAAAGLACAAAAALLLTYAPEVALARPFAGIFLVQALAAAALTRLPPDWLGRGLSALLILVTLTVAAAAAHLGRGLASPALAINGLLVCMLCVAAGWRAGVLQALVALAAVLGLAFGATAAGPPEQPLVVLLGTQLIALAGGLACGVMISRVIGTSMRAAAEREQRFRGLLALAADAYWEIDQGYRLRAASGNDPDALPLDSDHGLGAVPWELPHFGCDAEQLDALMADLDARQPFHDLLFTWTYGNGMCRHYLASGEPRFDARGVFKGYWGVARDVSEMHSARAALEATETRYQELFARIPTPLVLHRAGRVIDANPAALNLFGHAELHDMLDTDLLRAYEAGDSRERASQRLEQLQDEPVGTALPVADFRLRVGTRPVSVRATTVKVETEGGPAMLAIYVDDTERLAAEDAVRRSESMLAHLVATSPDLITLTDMASGRYAMVNHAFERLIGWPAAEAVGRTSLELGVWGDEHQRENFVNLLRQQGSVSNLPVPFVARSGQRVAMLVSAARFVMDRRDYVVINARDVTESERARLEREAILENASIGIAVTREHRFVLANPHFEQIYGWGPGELIGRSGHVVWPSDEAYAEVGRIAGATLALGEPVELESEASRKDGTRFMARVRGRAIDPSRPIEGGTAWIVEDVTQRRDFELALARARDDAEAANRAKSAFLANTSHELRTPLNGMIGLARLAAAPDVDEARRRQYLDHIADSAQALAGVISDILDLSKIEAGKLQLECTVFDLGELMHNLHQIYTALATAHGLVLRFEPEAQALGLVRGDPLRVRQIISNFLNNALKFTAHGEVRVSARRGSGDRADRVRVEVQDTGPGIDEPTCARLFAPFTQADQSTTRRYGGTGLGLSICRELAALMQGEVGVHSAPGQGSTFWAELPLPALGQPQALPSPTDPAPPPVDEAALYGTVVLMVEDNPVNMMIGVAMLERWGVKVAQATDGNEAVGAVQAAAAAGQPFDAVLMDVQMPVMSGHEATRALRATPQGKDLPVIALTAAALVSERDEALASGMNDFLTKPIDADRLRAALVRWCRPGAASPASTDAG